MSMKKMQKSLDTVRSDVRELVEAFWALRDEVMTHQAVSAAERQSQAAIPDISALSTDLLADSTEEIPSAGGVQQAGNYEMTEADGSRRIWRWGMERRPVEDVLALPLDNSAAVLAAIGHKQRLGMVLMLMRRSATANEIVAGLTLGTTGAAYHHLNVLQRSGLVRQEQRGAFAIVPERVPELIVVLSGLSGLIETAIEEVPGEAPVEDEPGSDDVATQ